MKFEVETQVYRLIIGRKIQELRRTSHMSQETLCRGLISQSALSLIENGKYPIEDSVLLELARRLKDKWLIQQTELLNFPLHEIDEVTLLELLISFKGSWFPTLAKLALDLASYYFKGMKLESVNQIVDTVINNNTEKDAYFYTACYYKGRVLIKEFRYKEAYDWLQMSIHEQGILDPLKQAESWYYLGYSSFFLERIELAQNACDRCIRLCEEYHFFRLWAMGYGLQGTLLRKAGQYKDAIVALKRAYDMMLQIGGTEDDKFRTQLSIADNMELLGNFEESENILLKSCNEYAGKSSLEHMVSLSSAYRILARLKHYRGLTTEADLYLSRAIQCAEESGDAWSMGWSYLLAVGLAYDAEEKTSWASKAKEIALRYGQQLQGAIANECLTVLSNNSIDGSVIEAVKTYRHLALNGDPNHFPTLRLLPIFP